MNNLWQELATKKITQKEQILNYLTQQLGEPIDHLSSNCLQELIKKINSYYLPGEPINWTIYSLFGSVQEISQRKFKEGKRKDQIYYLLKMGGEKKETILAYREDLPAQKWSEIEQLAILGKNLVFKYRKFYNNKQLLDFQKP